MDLVRTGVGISKALRNIGRLREIVTIFARNGFDEFITLGVTSRIPGFVLPKSRKKISQELKDQGENNFSSILGRRLRLCFEELGPAFVKFGQLLSSREDLFEQPFIDEMKILRDKVKGVPFEEIKFCIEKSLENKLENVFEEFDQNPIGTASIGTVYRAKYKGHDVVVKVRRPNIEKLIETDFSIMLFLIQQVEKASLDVKYLGLSKIIRDFSISLQNELNFYVEAMNCKRFKENLAKNDPKGIFYIPEIYSELVREDILVMEFLDGIPFSDQEKIKPHLTELQEKLDYGLALFMRSFLQDGFFHADLHGGNFFYLKDTRIGIVDYGLMGTLSRKTRQNLVAIMYALVSYNYENLIYEFLDVASYEKIPDVDNLISDVKDGLSPYVGLTVQQTNYSEVFQVIMRTLSKHRLFLPRDWFIVFRGLITLDGVGKSLGIDFDIFGLLENDLKDIIKSNYKKEDVVEEFVWAARDIIPSLRMLPRHLKWFIRDISKNNYALEIHSTGYEKNIDNLSKSLVFGGFCLFSAVLIYSGVVTLNGSLPTHWVDIPILTWILWVFGVLAFLKGLFIINKI